ncbi:hypothetical protein FHT44_006198 [Mycolicibacterium sp. BK634]|uniref:S-4TM family putative pore-forming effector n=1 Tax=Mycolicibacterium sp. BK634 TaxID=2587099 RepID=UPI001610A4AD|nr:S-4TM family putative pore-forming effector [Mycolicibacterium sp. BK634]MBB3753676.1 hypothetical protein [Mycolicibacterium sp. BK634]
MAVTTPPISEAQNTDNSRRHVAAQARTYSDAKAAFGIRVFVVFLLAVVGAVCAVRFPSARGLIGGGGGAALLLLSIAAGSLEKTWRYRAAAIQEEFDTSVFQIRWNRHQADRPISHEVYRAANRYDGGRDGNWYESTESTCRPYDVLICQSSNLGWGTSMHFRWAWMLIGALTFLVLALLGAKGILHLSMSDFLLAVAVPFLAPIKEIFDQIKSNFETASAKATAERKITDLWNQGMGGGETPSEQDLRDIQDKILQFRQSNPYIPDWLDGLFHSKNEAAMRSSVKDRVEEARRRGHAKGA